MNQLVCVDPGFASIGYAKILLIPTREPLCTAFGVFHTVKSEKKHKVLSTEDNVKRTIEIAKFFRNLCTTGEGRTLAICAEAMSFPRSSSVAAKMALAWGVICSFSEAAAVPILQASPQHVKRHVCGITSATKEEVETMVKRLYPESIAMSVKIKKGDLEHCFDALAVGHTMLQSDVVKMVRRVA